MPRAVPEPLRREIVRRHQAGESLAGVATALQLPYDTVRGLWRRFRKQGEAAFVPGYARCARPGPRFDTELPAQALAQKRAHPSFGAGVIRLLLAEAFPTARLPQTRTLQTWFQQAGLTTRRARKVCAPRPRGRTAHAVWQLDTKERVGLGDGSETCVFSLVDEATGAVLGAVTFPPGPGPGRSGNPDPKLAAPELRALGTTRTTAGG